MLSNVLSYDDFSGAEDQHGYLWDRHYGTLLTRFKHNDVVNSVAFHPKDSETLITVSDDNTVKVWRSRNRCRQLGLFLSGLDVGPKPEAPTRREPGLLDGPASIQSLIEFLDEQLGDDVA